MAYYVNVYAPMADKNRGPLQGSPHITRQHAERATHDLQNTDKAWRTLYRIKVIPKGSYPQLLRQVEEGLFEMSLFTMRSKPSSAAPEKNGGTIKEN